MNDSLQQSATILCVWSIPIQLPKIYLDYKSTWFSDQLLKVEGEPSRGKSRIMKGTVMVYCMKKNRQYIKLPELRWRLSSRFYADRFA